MAPFNCTIYEGSNDADKKKILDNLVPQIVDHRMEHLQILLNDKKLQELAPDTNQTLQTMLDPHNVEQHRGAIQQSVLRQLGISTNTEAI
ncbi:unnamed protein product [marine sediment metagenome]|uniref:Uncharacterized protein n=1 Tax=marine sediment metagenome TaxID=412755 RepID=X1BSE4_9ZZZZ